MSKNKEGDEEEDEVEDEEDFLPKAKTKASKQQQQKRKAVESFMATQPPRKRDAPDAPAYWDIEAVSFVVVCLFVWCCFVLGFILLRRYVVWRSYTMTVSICGNSNEHYC